MREIKFRAWNKEKNIMCYRNEDHSAQYLDGWYASDIQIINQTLNSDEYRYEFMQYTGLPDKNGVEICEGDILKVHYIGGNGFEYNEVIEDRGAFCVNYSEDYHPLLNEVNHCSEVIGNVWENKDLLKEENNRCQKLK